VRRKSGGVVVATLPFRSMRSCCVAVSNDTTFIVPPATTRRGQGRHD
jgi:hypothetical protein